MRTCKYNAKKTVVDGYKFDSKMEAKRYQQLKLLEKAGEIKDLEIHPKFTLWQPFDNDTLEYIVVKRGAKEEVKKLKSFKINYIADFQYVMTKTDTTIVEDVKGVKTAIYKLKRAMFIGKYDEYITFKEVYM